MTAKEFLETKTLTLGKDVYGGYKITYAYLVTLLEEYEQGKVESFEKHLNEMLFNYSLKHFALGIKAERSKKALHELSPKREDEIFNIKLKK